MGPTGSAPKKISTKLFDNGDPGTLEAREARALSVGMVSRPAKLFVVTNDLKLDLLPTEEHPHVKELSHGPPFNLFAV